MMVNHQHDPSHTGAIIVDHGSQRSESNAMLEAFVERFRRDSPYSIVQPAHMELAEPSISTAFDCCVQQGAHRVVVIPYFLLPGRHWDKDIPALTKAAASQHPDVPFLVGAPIGLHPMMIAVIQARLDHCIAHAEDRATKCEICIDTDRCVWETASPPPQ